MVTPAAIVAAPGLGHPVIQNIPAISPPIGPNIPMIMRNKPMSPPFVKNQFNRGNNAPIRVPGPNFAVPGFQKQKPKHKSNSTLSRTDPYYYLAPDKYPVKGPDFSTEIDDTSPSWQPYVNKKFFTTLPSTIKYKNPFFDSSPTSIKYVYKKVKDKKKKNKHKHEEDDDHHGWFHGWNPFSCSEDEEEHSKESGDDDDGEDEDFSVEEGTEFSILRRKDKHKYKKKKKWILKILFGLLVILGIKCLISRYFFAFFPAFFTTTARDEVPNDSLIEDEGTDEFDRTHFISDRQLREYRSFFSPCYDETKIDFSLPSIRNRIKRILNFDEND